MKIYVRFIGWVIGALLIGLLATSCQERSAAVMQELQSSEVTYKILSDDQVEPLTDTLFSARYFFRGEPDSGYSLTLLQKYKSPYPSDNNPTYLKTEFHLPANPQLQYGPIKWSFMKRDEQTGVLLYGRDTDGSIKLIDKRTFQIQGKDFVVYKMEGSTENMGPGWESFTLYCHPELGILYQRRIGADWELAKTNNGEMRPFIPLLLEKIRSEGF
ncbi:MAG: hypothetical protein AAGI38_24455 [Bacteroidota bacterium]